MKHKRKRSNKRKKEIPPEVQNNNVSAPSEKNEENTEKHELNEEVAELVESIHEEAVINPNKP